MIDLNKERLIPLEQVPNFLVQRGCKKYHVGTIRRWATKGLRGRKLESWELGRELYTSVAALGRFMQPRGNDSDFEQEEALRRALYGKPR